MRSRFLALLILAAPTFAVADPNPIAPTEALTPADEKAKFKLPPGFEAQLVASEPDILKPIQMAFDAKGRLWVTNTTEYPFPAVGRPGKDRVSILEDFGPDGKARKVTTFADDLNIPIGVLPMPDCKSVIVSSVDPGEGKEPKPSVWIWKLTDTDGDGKADKREKLYGPFGVRDTHGMVNSFTLMPDGWVYACHGYLNDSRVKGTDGQELVMNSGNTFRFRPDGSHIEIWTRGQVNPFGIAVDPYFNLYTADCHSKPITQLIHGAYYESFGKPHDGLGFAPEMIRHGHNSTALCGLVYYAADHFPKQYHDCMFLGNVTANRINLDKIEFTGSTPNAVEQPDFLVSSDMWFRPTDIKLGPDGALWVSDFYNKIIGHYEVDLHHPGRDKFRGRVWRIVWRGNDGKGEAPNMPGDLTKGTTRDLLKDLGQSNLATRLLATLQLIQRGRAEGWMFLRELVEARSDKSNPQRNAHELWVLAAAQSDWFKDAALKAISSKESPLVRVHAVRAASAFREGAKQFEPAIVDRLTDEDPWVRRAATDALGLNPFPGNVAPLLELYRKTPGQDTHLRFAIRVALREQLLNSENWQAIVLKNRSEDDSSLIAEVCLAVPNRAAADHLFQYLQFSDKDQGRFPDFLQHVARFGEKDTLAKLPALLSGKLPQSPPARVAYFQALQRGFQQRGEAVPAELVKLAEAVARRGLESTDATALQSAIDLAGALRLSALYDPLVRIALDRARAAAQRAAAFSALLSVDGGKAIPLLGKVLTDGAEPIGLRERAAQVLASANQLASNAELYNALATAEARLANVIAAGLASSAQGAEHLLSSIEQGKASARLLQDRVVRQRINERNLPKAAERIAKLTKGLPSADERIADLMKQRRNGFYRAKPDPMAGLQVFTKSCAICHQMNNQGTKIGPQLDGVGGRGLERLLEDILDPNRNVDAAMRQTTINLKDGGVLNGLVLREVGQVVVLADQNGKEVSVKKDDIDERRVSLLSPMPANLVETIKEKDFYDLLAYLLSQRAKEGGEKGP